MQGLYFLPFMTEMIWKLIWLFDLHLTHKDYILLLCFSDSNEIYSWGNGNSGQYVSAFFCLSLKEKKSQLTIFRFSPLKNVSLSNHIILHWVLFYGNIFDCRFFIFRKISKFFIDLVYISFYMNPFPNLSIILSSYEWFQPFYLQPTLACTNPLQA